VHAGCEHESCKLQRCRRRATTPCLPATTTAMPPCSSVTEQGTLVGPFVPSEAKHLPPARHAQAAAARALNSRSPFDLMTHVATAAAAAGHSRPLQYNRYCMDRAARQYRASVYAAAWKMAAGLPMKKRHASAACRSSRSSRTPSLCVRVGRDVPGGSARVMAAGAGPAGRLTVAGGMVWHARWLHVGNLQAAAAEGGGVQRGLMSLPMRVPWEHRQCMCVYVGTGHTPPLTCSWIDHSVST
jgi:hypothetical protein